MKHVKRIGIIAGACAPCVSNTCHQEELIKITKEKENSIKAKIDKECQHDCSRTAMVVYTAIDKYVEIDDKLIERFKDHELGLKHVPFQWTLSNDIINLIRMNYYKKEDFRCKALKAVNTCEKLEHECEEESVKEILKNAEVNNKKNHRS